MDTMKIKPEVREKIRDVCVLYECGRHDLLNLLRVHDLGKRGPEITLEMAVESIENDIENLTRLRDALKGEQAMGHLKKEWGVEMSICDECQLIGTVCRGTDGLETCKDFVRNPHSRYQYKQEPCGKFAETVLKIFDEEKALYKKKAEQYSQGDPLANFRGGAALQGLNPESLDDCFRVLLGYCDKHIAFVHQSGKLGKKEAESLKDIANYMVIALGMYQLKREIEMRG